VVCLVTLLNKEISLIKPLGGQRIRYGYRRDKKDIGNMVNVANHLETNTSIPTTWTRVDIPLTANGIQQAYSQLVLGAVRKKQILFYRNSLTDLF
jgi:hypothetical protein